MTKLLVSSSGVQPSQSWKKGFGKTHSAAISSQNKIPRRPAEFLWKSHLQFPWLWKNICQHITTTRGKDETNCLENYFTKLNRGICFNSVSINCLLNEPSSVFFFQVNDWQNRLVFQYVANNCNHHGPLNQVFALCISAQKSMTNIRQSLISLQVAENPLTRHLSLRYSWSLSKAALDSSGTRVCSTDLFYCVLLGSICKSGL